MSTSEPILDSPTSWVRKHIEEYVESDGENGHLWKGAPSLLLTTEGRKTGQLRRSALIYGRDGDNYVIVASKGGAPHHPAWYLNLTANPIVRVQVKAEEFSARARTSSGDERQRLWTVMTAIWPSYDDYATRTDRQIPVVVLEPLPPAEA